MKVFPSNPQLLKPLGYYMGLTPSSCQMQVGKVLTYICGSSKKRALELPRKICFLPLLKISQCIYSFLGSIHFQLSAQQNLRAGKTLQPLNQVVFKFYLCFRFNGNQYKGRNFIGIMVTIEILQFGRLFQLFNKLFITTEAFTKICKDTSF